MHTQPTRQVEFHPTAVTSDGYRLTEGMPVKTSPTCSSHQSNSRHWGRGRIHAFSSKNRVLVTRPRKGVEEVDLSQIKLDKTSCTDEGYPVVRETAKLKPDTKREKPTPTEADRVLQQLKFTGKASMPAATLPVEETKPQVTTPNKPKGATGALLAGVDLPELIPGHPGRSGNQPGQKNGQLLGGLDTPPVRMGYKPQGVGKSETFPVIENFTMRDETYRPGDQVLVTVKGQGEPQRVFDEPKHRSAPDLDGQEGQAVSLGTSIGHPPTYPLIPTSGPQTSNSPPPEPPAPPSNDLNDPPTGFDFNTLNNVLAQARVAAARKLKQLLADRDVARALLQDAETEIQTLETQCQQLGFDFMDIHKLRREMN